MSTYIYKDDQQQGPYDDEYIEMCLNKGKLSYDDHCWKEGWEEWKPLSAAFTRPTPPPPPKASSATPQPSPTATAKSEISASDKTEEKLSSPIQELRNDIDLIFKLNPSFRRVLKGDMIDAVEAANIYKAFKNISESKDQILFSILNPFSLIGIKLPLPCYGIVITEKNVYIKGQGAIFTKNLSIKLNTIREFSYGQIFGGFKVNGKTLLGLEPTGAYIFSKYDRDIIELVFDAVCRMNLKGN